MSAGVRAAVVHPDPAVRGRLAETLRRAGHEAIELADLGELEPHLRSVQCVCCSLELCTPERSPAGETLRRSMNPGSCAVALLPDISPQAVARARREAFDDFVEVEAACDMVVARVELAVRSRAARHDLEVRTHDATVLLELSQKLASSLEIEEILHEATKLVADALAIDRCAVVLLDRDAGRGLIVATSEDRTVTDLEIRLDDYPELRRLLDSSAPVIITDASRSAVVAEVEEILREKRVGAELLFPIIHGEQVVGALFLRSATPLAGFDERRTSFGMTVASSLGIAIGNAKLFHDFRTRTRRAERRMRALRQYEEIFEYAADGMAVLDRDGRILYLNREGGRVLGTSPAGPSRLFADSLDTASQRVFGNLLGVARRGQAVRNIDLVAVHPSGEVRTLLASASPVGAGRDLIVVSFRDVTELREMQTELKTTKDFLENLIDSSVDGIVAADLRGNVLLFNKGAERIYGYAAHEVIGRIPVWRLYPEGVAVQIMRELRRGDRGGVGRVVQRRTEILDKRGQRVPVSLNASILYENGVEVATVGIFSDLRERIRMERELEEAQRRLIESEKRAAVVELAGAAAHELNQPLTSVLGYAEMLQRKVKPDEAIRRHVDIIHREAGRMAEIVRKIGRITKYRTKPYGGGARIVDIDRSSEESHVERADGPPRIPPARQPQPSPGGRGDEVTGVHRPEKLRRPDESNHDDDRR